MTRKCFVLMPFSDLFDKYYKNILIPSIRDAGYEPIRADEIYGTRPIIDDIFNGIREAEVLVADVSGKNPNVNYELGVAHALKRPVVIISQRAEDIPFDYRHLRAIIYDTQQDDWASCLRSKITKTLQDVQVSYSNLPTEAGQLDTRLGVIRIYKDRSHIDFIELVRRMKPKSELKILGTGLWDIASSRMQAVVRQKLAEDCRVKFLFLDPDSDAAVERSREQGWHEFEDYRAQLCSFDSMHKSFINSLPPELRTNIELGHYNSRPSYLIFVAGDKMIIGFYLSIGPATFSPHLELEIKEGGIYEAFLNHFNALWEKRMEASPSGKDVDQGI